MFALRWMTVLRSMRVISGDDRVGLEVREIAEMDDLARRASEPGRSASSLRLVCS